MRDFIRDAMGIVQQQTDAKLRAYVLMSNHVHLLLQHGLAPLAAFMQPLLCRVALAVRKRCGAEGHIFERTYWDSPCGDELHLHTIVNYIHANPVSAGLCSDPSQWDWSSYACYADPARAYMPVVDPLFRVESVSHQVFCPADVERELPRLDLRDLLALALHDLTGGGLTLLELRLSRSRAATGLRRKLIVRAATAGYRGSLIANALGVSEATVSKVVRAEQVPRARLIGAWVKR